MKHTADISRISRQYMPADFVITDWVSLEPYFKELSERPINSVTDLERWLHDVNELEAIVSEDACWRQIRMTCDTTDKQFEESFNYFYLELQPKIQPFSDVLNKKLVESPFLKELDADKYYTITTITSISCATAVAKPLALTRLPFHPSSYPRGIKPGRSMSW